jgi:hypothetical protein
MKVGQQVFVPKQTTVVASQAQTPSAPASSAPEVQDQVVSHQEATTPLFVKAGKVALTLAAAGGAVAMGVYSGNHSGGAAVLAGTLAGGLTGATGLGVVGLMADIAGGIMSTKNVTPKMAAAGAVIGAGLGALASGNQVAGLAMGVGAGIAAAALSGAATNILHK